jgi:hypothetical protein
MKKRSENVGPYDEDREEKKEVSRAQYPSPIHTGDQVVPQHAANGSGWT